MRKLLTFLALTLGFSTPLEATDPSDLRSLITGDDSRGWEAVGRLNMGGESFCTGALIAENLVLTAGHCLFDKDTGRAYAAEDIEFLAGWRNGRASAYRGVRRAVVHPDFDFSGRDKATRVAHDLAILELDRPIRTTSVIPFSTTTRPRKGAEVGVVSYAHDRSESPALQEMCHVLARQSGTLVLSCDVDFGSSGAPVFVHHDGEPRIVSVVSAKATVRDIPVSLGTSLERPLAEMMAILDQSDGVFTRVQPTSQVLTQQGSRDATGAKFLRP
ncbi:trypsin-like serine protease [Aliiroseovarius subalbicans]|uniref:trypsin-like serine peptidase n=1 Tax=Aliiroseovarius subalbicans TaxID=2925840 RepID=UPI001F596F03|nr:trypsin-like serine protease [Aliiroseovarius subalbicans]MCI2400733.1 trypsin-like serine protease [Aliiroseovarius subalbicans]